MLLASAFFGGDLHEMSNSLREKKGPQNLLPECFVCVEVLRLSQPNGVMSSVVSLPNHTFTGQA